jgi:N-methylhydantoinase B/oxoprolinase/acetone carboxylase alpha subunit
VSQQNELGRDGYCTLASDGDTLTFNVAPGGGWGDPRERDPSLIDSDIRAGLLTPAAAERDYGFAATPSERRP